VRASSGLTHSWAGGTQLSCGLVILTKLVIRVELEQQTYADSNIIHEPGTDYPERISGLRVLLEGAPPLPERKLLWHCALEKLLDGTRKGSNAMVDHWNCGLKSTAELHARVEGLESLKIGMQAMGMSIAKAVSDGTLIINHDTDPFHQEMINIEFEKLVSTETVDSAQAATATSHKEWLDIESADVRVEKNLSNLFAPGRTLKEKLESEKTLKVHKAFNEYYNQGEPRKRYHQTDLIQICQI